MKHLLLIIMLSLFSIPLMSMGNREVSSKPLVGVSIVPEKTFVEAVAGEECDVVVMVPPGASPETYEPTIKERARLEQASLYFAIGVPVEETGLERMEGKTKIVHLDEVARKYYPDLEIGSSRDPHIWLSPKRVEKMVSAIADELSLFLPEREKVFRSNAEAFIAELREVDKEIRSSIQPMKEKEFIVFHPAFGYFADEYGLKQFALEEEGKEASAKHLAAMVDLAKAKGLKVVFYQAETDSRQSQAFAEEVGGVAKRLEPLSADYLENLRVMAEAFRSAQ